MTPPAGYYPNGGTGSGDGWGSQAPCPLGSYCLNGVRTACGAGQFANVTGAASCTPCARGTFAPSPGQMRCAACVAGEDSYPGSPLCWPAVVAAYAVNLAGGAATPAYASSGLSVGDAVVVQLSSPAASPMALPVAFESMASPGVYTPVSLGTVTSTWNAMGQQLVVTITDVATASPDAVVAGECARGRCGLNALLSLPLSPLCVCRVGAGAVMVLVGVCGAGVVLICRLIVSYRVAWHGIASL